MTLWPLRCAGVARPWRQGERITSSGQDSTFPGALQESIRVRDHTQALEAPESVTADRQS
jgi:hypothetical protein